MSRMMKIIFTISILLNLVFIGLGVGMTHKFSRKMPPDIKQMQSEISPEARAMMKQRFEEGREGFFAMMREAKQKRDAVEAALAAPEFDAEAYDAAVSDMLSMKANMEKRKAAWMKDMAENLSDEDRQKMAKFLSDKMSGHHPHKHWKKDRGNKRAPQE
jgi:uncharacterized membrane protein